ncbi:hypothetical protein SAMN02744786_2864 [Stenotrophomonas sp. CC120222-04]|nr:hypothetical protein SAMN02744786_2864 [Stenotrophomonas sp. CC120222-04]
MVRESEVRDVLRGIDSTETTDVEGWWETSSGAKFGEQRLLALLALLEKRGVLIVDGA